MSTTNQQQQIIDDLLAKIARVKNEEKKLPKIYRYTGDLDQTMDRYIALVTGDIIDER